MTFHRSLIFKISILIIVSEILILFSVGYYNIRRFSAEVDDKIRLQVQLPGKLMNKQLLKYESIADQAIMNETVGEHFIEGFVFNKNRIIYYALDKSAVGRDFFDHTRLALPQWHPALGETLIQKIEAGSDGYLVCVTPLVAYEGAAPFFFSTIKVSTNKIEAQKKDIIRLFVAGSMIGVVLTSIIIILFTRLVITRPLGKLENIADHIARGDLEQNLSLGRGDELGSLCASFMTMKDAVRNAMQKLEASERKYRSIFENASEGIIQFSLDGRILMANRSLAHILGVESEAFLIGHIYNYYEDANRHIEIIDLLSRLGKVVNCESAVIRKTKEKIYVSENFHLVTAEDHGVAYIEGLVEDITDRKKAVEAMRKAKEAAEKANQAKSDFLANISHELRTPLNGILTSVELGYTYDMPPEMMELCSIIKSSSYSLLNLVEGMLRFNRSEDLFTELDREPFFLENVLLNIPRTYLQKGVEKTVTVTFDIDAASVPNALVGHHHQLSDVLARLVDNAAKFNQNRPKVSIRISQQSRQSNDVVLHFCVKDNGIGIAEENFAMIFEAFSQVDASSTRRYDGMGIGLSVCKKLVNLMGGQMGVESELGAGSRFYFTARFETQATEKRFDPSTLNTQTNGEAAALSMIPRDPDGFVPIIHDLEQSLNTLDPSLIKTLSQSLKSVLPVAETEHLLALVNDYDYEDARDVLMRIKSKYL